MCYLSRLLCDLQKAIHHAKRGFVILPFWQIPHHRRRVAEFKRCYQSRKEPLLNVKLDGVNNGQLRLFLTHQLHDL